MFSRPKRKGGNHHAVKSEPGLLLRQRGGAVQLLPRPQNLLTDPRYKSVSIEAKVLYGLLLDRMGLSVKNGWMDSDGRVYIYGHVFHLLDLIRRDEAGVDTQTHTETVTMDSATGEHHTSIQVEIKGYKTSTRNLSATRTYPSLSDADLSLIHDFHWNAINHIWRMGFVIALVVIAMTVCLCGIPARTLEYTIDAPSSGEFLCASDAYRDCLTYFHDWYAEGLMVEYSKDYGFLPPLTGPKGTQYENACGVTIRPGSLISSGQLFITEDEARRSRRACGFGTAAPPTRNGSRTRNI